MTDERQPDGFDEAPPTGHFPGIDDDVTDIAWGLVAFLAFLALLATFAIQNSGPVAVEFLWFDFQLRVWVLLLSTVLLTVTFDQLVSLLYRRRKRQAKRARAAED
jgi:uncharacterized integral membrane protein